jgi:hypothetical protein
MSFPPVGGLRVDNVARWQQQQHTEIDQPEMSAFEGKLEMQFLPSHFRFCEGFRMPAL